MKDNKVKVLEDSIHNLLLSDAIFVGMLIYDAINNNWTGCYILGSFVAVESIAILVLQNLKKKRIKKLNKK